MASILDLAKSAFRNWSTDGLPATGPNQPVKSEIVNVFVAIYSALAAIGISGAVTVAKATRALLLADLSAADGALAIVHSDGTAANNGVYKKSGASGSGTWTIVFQLDVSALGSITALSDRVTGVERDTAPQAAAIYSEPIYYDVDGVLGTPLAVYAPLTMQVQRAGVTTTKTDIGAASAELPAHTKIVLPNLTSMYLVYLDISAGAANARLKYVTGATSMPAADGNAIPICVIRGRRVMQRRFDIRMVSDGGMLHPRDLVVVQSDLKTLLLAPYYGSNGDYALSDAVPATRWTTYVIASASTNPVWVVKNLKTGALSEIVQPAMPAQPLYGVVCCRAFGRFTSAGGYDLIGSGVRGGLMANQAVTGKNNLDAATIVFGRDTGAPVAAITTPSATLQAAPYGLTQVWKNTAAQGTAQAGTMWVGGQVEGAAPGRVIFGRAIIEVEAGGVLGNPRVSGVNSKGVASCTFAATIVTQISATAWDVCAWGVIPAGAEVTGVLIGTLGGGVGGAGNPSVGWPRFGVATSPLWISEDDLGGGAAVLDVVRMTGVRDAAREMLVPNKLFAFEGRDFRLYATSLTGSDRQRGQDQRLLLESTSADAWKTPYVVTGGYEFDVRADKLGATVRLSTTSAFKPDENRPVATIPVRRTLAAAVVGKAPKVLLIADSIHATQGVAASAKRKCLAAGMTGPIYYGTIQNEERFTNAPVNAGDPTSGVIGYAVTEAREGWRASDYSGEGGDPSASRNPLVVGQEATYAAASNGTRKSYNPFLRNVKTTDSAFVKQHAWKRATVQNTAALNYYVEQQAGRSPSLSDYYTFDCEFWRTRFALTSIGTFAVPNTVIIGLGTNELNDYYNNTNTLDPLGYIQRALEAMIANIRAAWPSTRIFLIVPNLAYTRGGRTRWSDASGQAAMIKLHIAFAKTWLAANPGDEGYLDLLDGWLRMSPDAYVYWQSFTNDYPSTYGQTGYTNEVVHPYGAVMEQLGELEFAAIADVARAL